MLCENFEEKKKLFVLSCPKLICCPERQFGPSRLKSQNREIMKISTSTIDMYFSNSRL